MQINKTVNEIHDFTKSVGRWDDEPNYSEIFLEQINYIIKARKSHFSGKPALYAETPTTIIDNPNTIKRQPGLKPKGEAISLAAVVLEIMDYFGYMSWDLEEMIQINYNHAKVNHEKSKC